MPSFETSERPALAAAVVAGFLALGGVTGVLPWGALVVCSAITILQVGAVRSSPGTGLPDGAVWLVIVVWSYLTPFAWLRTNAQLEVAGAHAVFGPLVSFGAGHIVATFSGFVTALVSCAFWSRQDVLRLQPWRWLVPYLAAAIPVSVVAGPFISPLAYGPVTTTSLATTALGSVLWIAISVGFVVLRSKELPKPRWGPAAFGALSLGSLLLAWAQ